MWQGGQRQFDYLTGALAPSQDSIDNFSENVKARQGACASKGLSFAHVVFPSKPTVMAEFLPEDTARRVRSLYQTHYTPVANESVLYPRATLIREKAARQVFSQQDTHMTETGDAIVAREILLRLGNSHDPLDFLEVEQRNRLGDLAIMAGIDQPILEDFLFNSHRMDQFWDNRPFLPANTDNIAITHNARSASGKRLLAIGDSFLKNCLKPLSTFYRDILYVRSDVFQAELIGLFSPDDVVTATAERYLCQVRSDADAESVILRAYARPNYDPDPSFVAALKAQLSRGTHPERYLEWVGHVGALCFDRLGVGKLNEHLATDPYDPSKLLVIGNDPQIIFSNSAMKKDLGYRLIVTMESDTSGEAQLFESNGIAGKYPYSEARSHKRDVQAGENTLIFDVQPSQGRQLRFDPLDRPGKVRLASMDLVDA